MIGRIRKLIILGCSAFACVIYGGTFVSAQTTSLAVPDLGVDASTVATNIGTSIGPWILGAIGVGIALFVVRLGWRKFKGMAN